MSTRIYAATRKGLFTIDKKSGNGGWGITRTAFLGDPVSAVLPDNRDGSVYAALNLGHFGVKFHRSGNNGETWEEAVTPAYPKDPDKPELPPSSEGEAPPAPSGNIMNQIWIMDTGGKDEPGVLWAGTNPGGLFRSDDRGSTWQLNEPLWNIPERSKWFGGGYESPGIHSICVDPTDSKHVSVGVSIGGFWSTTDGGKTWSSRAKGMRNAYMPPGQEYDENSQDPHRIVQCAGTPEAYWAQHHNGIFRSTDGAASWQEITDVPPSVFGFAVAVHPRDPQTAWFVPAIKDEHRYPVDAKVVVSRTRDGGKSFDVLRRGLPQENAYDLVYRHGMDIDSEGNQLVIGSTTGSLWVSENQGDSWQNISANLPPVYAVRFA